MFLLYLVGLATAAVFFIRHLYSYWERKGFPFDKPSIRNGYRRRIPEDFHDRGIYVDEKNDPFSGNLFALQGERWRTLRNKLTPSFSSGKLKGMFGTIEDVGNRMVEYLNNQVPESGSKVIKTKSLLATYAVDIIGSVIFGLEVNSFKNPDNKFRSISKKLNTPKLANVLKIAAKFLFPPLEKILVKLRIDEESADLMKDIVRRTVEYREKNNYSRKDLMQLLIQVRNTGKINLDDTTWNTESAADGFKSMSIESVVGHANLFYAAGYETTAATASFTLHELSQNPEILAKVLEDIDKTLAKHDGQVTYESVQDMKYLELCIMETVRKYPGLPILNRECTMDFPILGTDNVIPKGSPIIIPLFGIQRNEEYFPDPMKYEPERYLESNMNYNPVAYMPFGEGPRHCIALRMGKINVKVALVKLLTNFDIEAIERKELEIDNFSVSIVPKDGVNIRMKRKLRTA